MAAVLVEIWSDVVCPWCFIGKHRFEGALGAFAGADAVRVAYRAFQLDPAAPPGQPLPVRDVYSEKFGGPEQADAAIERVTTLAAAEGIEFHLERALRANTLDAHRLLWLTDGSDFQPALVEALMTAYFCDGKDISDHRVLREAASACGLDAGRVEALLAGDGGRGEVAEQIAQAAAFGITAVPTYVIDRRWAVPGAQDRETFLLVLERASASRE